MDTIHSTVRSEIPLKQNLKNTRVLQDNENHLPTRLLLSIGGISYGGELGI